ncbi:hypothetical protein [Streptomyces sp. NPDC054797]
MSDEESVKEQFNEILANAKQGQTRTRTSTRRSAPSSSPPTAGEA